MMEEAEALRPGKESLHRMTMEGYSTTEIGRAIGRDHSTVSCLNRRMEDALGYPRSYREVAELWARFQDRISYEDDIHEDAD